MPTIFAIDGAELGYDLADFGAASSAVAALQTALVALGKGVGDPVLKVLVIDGLIGPKTTAATNRAFTTHIGAYQAPAHYRTGSLSQATVAANASDLAELVNTESRRRGYNVPTSVVIQTAAKAAAPKTTAIVPYTPPASPSVIPKSVAPSAAPALIPAGDDTRMQIIKWSSIGLGLVVVSAGIYYALKDRGMLGGSGLGDFGMKGDRINDHERELWVNNDEGLYRWYQREQHRGGGMRAFLKRNREEIDAAIRGVRDRPPAQTRLYGAGDFYHTSPSEFRAGQRVELHPSMDLWMRGARFGTVKKAGGRYVYVEVDKTGRTIPIEARQLQIVD
jgi:hypothetical protein